MCQSMATHAEKEDKACRFTASQDWFSHNAPAWRELFPLVTARDQAPRALEIGSWEGRSAVFLLEELCGTHGTLVCIDHFDLFRTQAGKARFETVQHNLRVANAANRARVIADFSVPALMQVLREEIALDESGEGEAGFDFVYIDGSHEADDTLLDGELAWRLARKGAVVIFDDYGWETEPADSRHHPRRGVDVFMQLHVGEFERLSEEGKYQMVLRKTSDMRIGFLVAGSGERQVEYGINIAYAIDAAYAMPLAVSLRSLLEHTPGRISAYILVHGVSNDERKRIHDSLPTRDDFTLQFIELGENTLAVKSGICWAKIDMLELLPVERVLYLDADTLVRKSVRPLWDLDLQDHPLGAVQDVGYPLGPTSTLDTPSDPYFNAGILLLELSKIRSGLVDLKAIALKNLSSQCADQDALNAHFSQRWLSMPLEWNAQGLGTYAKMRSPERAGLDVESMTNNAAIVHFTGPVHPTMNAVLNDWGQPYTAKPWGYAGAPGHPYAEEWRRTLEGTVWGDWRTSAEYEVQRDESKSRAMEVGIKEYGRRVLVGGSIPESL
ncbi:unnamed protein product [Peniophora sp. CBMAI 1063]|nr:unnamed protein product [Peniophora sp. CBMAI 1063]